MTANDNPPAQRLYERVGFQTEGRREAAVLVDGQPVDSILMARLWRKHGPAAGSAPPARTP